MPGKKTELSEIQKGIYFECQTGGKNIYNISAAIKISSHLDHKKFEQALNMLAEEQPVLRSHIEWTDGSVAMVVNEQVDTAIHYYDVSQESNQKTENQMRLSKKKYGYEFDLSKAPLFRVSLIENGREESVLVMNLHHIISDGVSLDIFINKLFTNYSKALKGERIEVQEDQGFLQFVETENQKLADGNYEKQKEYWKEKVKGAKPLDFPKDFSSAHDNNGMGKEKVFPISQDLMKRIEKTSQKEEVTPFIFCLAAFSALMGKYCHEENVVVSSPFTHRPGFDYEGTIGCFIYTLPLKVNIDENKPFKEVISAMYEEMIGAYKNIGYPNNLIAREVIQCIYRNAVHL